MNRLAALCFWLLRRLWSTWLLISMSTSAVGITSIIGSEEFRSFMKKISRNYEKYGLDAVAWMCMYLIYGVSLLFLKFTMEKCKCKCPCFLDCIPEYFRNMLVKCWKVMSNWLNLIIRSIIVIGLPVCSAFLSLKVKSANILYGFILLSISFVSFLMCQFSLQYERLLRDAQSRALNQPKRGGSHVAQSSEERPGVAHSKTDVRLEIQKLVAAKSKDDGLNIRAQSQPESSRKRELEMTQSKGKELVEEDSDAEQGTQQRHSTATPVTEVEEQPHQVAEGRESEIVVEDLGFIDMLVAIALGIAVQIKKHDTALLIITTLPGMYKIVIPFLLEKLQNYLNNNHSGYEAQSGLAPPGRTGSHQAVAGTSQADTKMSLAGGAGSSQEGGQTSQASRSKSF